MTHVISGAKAIALGNLNVQLQTGRHDEIGQLMMAMNSIGSGLSAVVQSVRQGSEGVASASAEIAQGNQDLSARTDAQASALEETAASMGPIQRYRQAKRRLRAPGQRTGPGRRTTALQGGEVVARVVETMNGINDASRKIADIIQVIDGIAFRPISWP